MAADRSRLRQQESAFRSSWSSSREAAYRDPLRDLDTRLRPYSINSRGGVGLCALLRDAVGAPPGQRQQAGRDGGLDDAPDDERVEPRDENRLQVVGNTEPAEHDGEPRESDR